MYQNRSELRLSKEEFVSGLQGGSKLEIVLIILFLCISILVGEQFKRWTLQVYRSIYQKAVPYSDVKCNMPAEALPTSLPPFLDLALEFLVVVLPHVFVTMSAARAAIGIVAAAAVLSLGELLFIVPQHLRRTQGSSGGSYGSGGGSGGNDGGEASQRLMCVSAFRGALMLASCVSILAVDFRAFPRRLAKTEHTGTGLMDTGVGFIVLAGGLVRSTTSGKRGARGLERRDERRERKGEPEDDHASPLPFWAPRTWLHNGNLALCWMLGFGRWALLSAVGYQVHVGEYGEHWNFFNTIAVVAVVSGAMAKLEAALLRRRQGESEPPVHPEQRRSIAAGHVAVALVITTAHQWGLTRLGLGDWAHSPVRGADLLSQNKEGIVSCGGYVAIHLWGRALGSLVREALFFAPSASSAASSFSAASLTSPRETRSGRHVDVGAPGPDVDVNVLGRERPVINVPTMSPTTTTASDNETTTLQRRLSPLVGLAVADVALWALALAAETWIEPISRRTCNSPYILWVAAQALLLLALLAAAEAWGSARGRPLRPRLLGAANRGMLRVFLAANLMTGIVNLTMDTMAVKDSAARAIVVSYMALVCAVAASHVEGRRPGQKHKEA